MLEHIILEVKEQRFEGEPNFDHSTGEVISRKSRPTPLHLEVKFKFSYSKDDTIAVKAQELVQMIRERMMAGILAND